MSQPDSYDNEKIPGWQSAARGGLIRGHKEGVPYTVTSAWADLWSPPRKPYPVKVFSKAEIASLERPDLTEIWRNEAMPWHLRQKHGLPYPRYKGKAWPGNA
jgi:hypothetical protein